MKKLIVGLCATLVLASCGNDAEKKANERLITARTAFEQGDYNEAKLQIDSIKILYPKAFDARREGISLMQQIELKEQQQSLVYLDSILQTKQKEFESIKNKYVLEKDAEYQQTGNYFWPTQTVEKNLHRSFLRFQVNEQGVMSMTSIYCGGSNLHHFAVKVIAPDGSFAETPASKDSYETTDLGEKIESFEFKSWQVFNVPTSSYLIDQSKQYVASEYKDSELQATYNNEGKLYAFNFYMQENLNEAIMKANDNTTLTAYKDREKEYKNPDGTNTGEYKFVEKNATYVEIKARMNIKTESEDGIRTADVRYIIHLGGVANDFTDFKSKRNKKYTYNVTINDVESIIVEVEDGEDDPNARPGVEGDVVDATTSVYTLDAHYNCFNIGFTYEDVVENLSFIIQSPFAADAVYSVKGKIGALDNTPQENGDYKWIQLQRTTGEKVLSQYNSGRKNRPFDLYQLVDDMKDRGKPNDGKTYYYTIFINEYYYTEAPAKANWPDKNHLWRYFVNQDDRKLMLFLSPKSSADKESSYSKASYMFRQRSIQTYYSTEVLNNDGNALGMEHVNETGAPNWGNGNSSDRGNGFLNTNKFFFTTSYRNRTWEYFVKYSISDDYKYTYEMRDVAAIAECLSRNRDENGDGIIDLDELKWYLPATDQLASMFLGAKSLPSPLFDDRSVSSVTYDDGNNHYITSNEQKIWAEEGCSFGGISSYGSKNYPKLLRCVRNLGLSNEDAKSKVVSPAYTYNSQNKVFIMDQLTSQNKRTGKTTGELDFHDNFDDINRPYKAFQMASTFIGGRNTDWYTLFDIGVNHLSKCKDLTEGGHKWRAPNQREFMIMFLQNASNVINNNNRGFTRTHWKYDESRHFGLNGLLLFLDNNGDYDRTIRCVRDVDVNANGSIIND